MNIRLQAASVFFALATTLMVFSPGRVNAQGIPVIDAANLIQTIQQVMNDITAINNQVQQISHLQSQVNSTTGTRHLGPGYHLIVS